MHTPLVDFLAGALAGSGGGLMAGLFGVGGGFILIPLLGFFLKLDQHQAQGVTLAALLLPNGLPAVLHYRKEGLPIPLALVFCLIVGFLGGVWGGAQLANALSATWLRILFIGLLLALATRMYFLKPPAGMEDHPPIQPSLAEIWLPGLLIGTVGGFASGLMGIGGAILMNPLLAWRLRMSQHQAQLTSLAMMLPPIGLPGVLVYARSQSGLPWMILAGLAVGFLFGAYLGARLATRTRGPRLRKLFAGLMVTMAGLLLMRGV